MLTNNFYKLLSIFLLYNSLPTAKKIIRIDGSTTPSYISETKLTTRFFVTQQLTTNGLTTHGICVGRGTTPPSRDDIALEDCITTGITNESASRNITFGEDYAEVVFAITLRNTTDSDITIAEVGYVAQHQTNSTSGSYAYSLIDRTVLDTPVTIPAGDAKSLSYSIRINFPT